MTLTLEGKIKKETGKGFNRKLRSQGLLPAVFYSKKENIPLTVDAREMEKLREKHGSSSLLDLSIEGDSKKSRKVIMRDLQTHPLKSGLVHVDFLEVDMKEKIKVTVPLVFVGHSPGEKMGGFVNHILKSINIKCLPGDIPHDIEVPLEEVELGQVLHVSDLVVPENVELLHLPGESVVSVFEEKVKEEEKPEEGEEVVEGEEGAEAKPEGEKAEGDKAPDKKD